MGLRLLDIFSGLQILEVLKSLDSEVGDAGD